MIKFFKDGIQRIKDTKKYASQKNIHLPLLSFVLYATALVFMLSAIVTLLGLLAIVPVLVFHKIHLPNFIVNTIQYYPFVMTFLFMIRFGHIPIKFFILLESLMQKGLMKLINKLDMYLWRKTGKDSMVSSFMFKHKTIVRIIFISPLIISLILQFVK